MADTSTDLLGAELDEPERAIADLYAQAKAVLARDDLAPCAEANVRAATAALGVLVSDLALEWEHLTDLDV